MAPSATAIQSAYEAAPREATTPSFVSFIRTLQSQDPINVTEDELIEGTHGGGDRPIEEEVDDAVYEEGDLVVVLAIVLFLILATVAFEALKGYLEESVPEDMEVILEKLFGELTVLGFLAIITFVLTQTGVLEEISVKVFGDGEREKLQEYFE